MSEALDAVVPASDSDQSDAPAPVVDSANEDLPAPAMDSDESDDAPAPATDSNNEDSKVDEESAAPSQMSLGIHIGYTNIRVMYWDEQSGKIEQLELDQDALGAGEAKIKEILISSFKGIQS